MQQSYFLFRHFFLENNIANFGYIIITVRFFAYMRPSAFRWMVTDDHVIRRESVSREELYIPKFLPIKAPISHWSLFHGVSVYPSGDIPIIWLDKCRASCETKSRHPLFFFFFVVFLCVIFKKLYCDNWQRSTASTVLIIDTKLAVRVSFFFFGLSPEILVPIRDQISACDHHAPA